MRNFSRNFIPAVFFLGILSFLYSCTGKDIQQPVNCAAKNVSVSATPVTSSGPTANDGAINVTAMGNGSSGFTYSINNGTFSAATSFTGLSAGTYNITAKDSDGCTGTTTATITSAACPTITVSGTVTNSSNNTSNNGTITATATGGSGLTFSINNGTFQPTGNFTALAPGNYTITAKSANGCTGSALFTVSTAGCPVITVTGTTTQTAGPTASNGSITASATGGATPYTYSKDGITFQTSATFNNLAVGNYNIVAKDVNGCSGSSAAITVTSAPCPTINVTGNTTASDKCTNNTGAITLSATGSSGFSYNLNGGAYQSNNIFSGLSTGIYTIGARDLNGCTSTASVSVLVAPNGPLFSAVRSLVTASCSFGGCHNAGTNAGGINLVPDCNIVSNATRIKIRAVDNVPSPMPAAGPLTAADKQKIVDWINAGGQQSN